MAGGTRKLGQEPSASSEEAEDSVRAGEAPAFRRMGEREWNLRVRFPFFCFGKHCRKKKKITDVFDTRRALFKAASRQERNRIVSAARKTLE